MLRPIRTTTPAPILWRLCATLQAGQAPICKVCSQFLGSMQVGAALHDLRDGELMAELRQGVQVGGGRAEGCMQAVCW